MYTPSHSAGLISKNLFKNYLSSILGEVFTQWFLNFFQIRSYLNFKEFEKLGERLAAMPIREATLVTFMMYDRNGDGFICPRDVFAIFEKQLDPAIQDDILQIGQFAKENEGRE
jgi:Ca2+-binding EF-hand superfamily protein